MINPIEYNILIIASRFSVSNAADVSSNTKIVPWLLNWISLMTLNRAVSIILLGELLVIGR